MHGKWIRAYDGPYTPVSSNCPMALYSFHGGLIERRKGSRKVSGAAVHAENEIEKIQQLIVVAYIQPVDLVFHEQSPLWICHVLDAQTISDSREFVPFIKITSVWC